MTGALARLIRRPARPGRLRPDRCDLCAVDIDDRHAHLWDEQHTSMLCVCAACRLLFPGTGHTYLPVPDRRTRLAGIDPAVLGVPVGLAYFVRNPEGTVTAHYPGPAGAATWQVEPAYWAAATTAEPALETLHPTVEALLVSAVRTGPAQTWLVPVTDCHRLTALIRTHWTGFLGGSQVWDEVRRFFDDLEPTTAGPRTTEPQTAESTTRSRERTPSHG